jgi:multicomponent Na+:H+ antiporter subunit E
MLLANSITLTPGTLAVDIRGDRILVHWVDCPPGTDLDRATRPSPMPSSATSAGS